MTTKNQMIKYVRLFCSECMGGPRANRKLSLPIPNPSDVDGCTAPECIWFDFRFGEDPKRIPPELRGERFWAFRLSQVRRVYPEFQRSPLGSHLGIGYVLPLLNQPGASWELYPRRKVGYERRRLQGGMPGMRVAGDGLRNADRPESLRQRASLSRLPTVQGIAIHHLPGLR